ncbi:MAG TPA: UDP-N-acetylmuramoyl-L-alanyl-D-glutamate--2,6-diaminopimelate ligase, partial [Stellaceae bacterium]|nr:UDP-N-acetylmuramoyl-L-alanyl-D-glutamate--2,6-diaminopimelate ligase [Stellaceae bacterium]
AIFIEVADARRALALAAARFFPSQPETIVAITGTSGKTSVAAFTRQIWLALGHSAASLGTIGLVSPSGATSGALTTPDPVKLHQTLDDLARSGVTHLALEASSHGLDQRRLDGVRLAAGAFTNLSRDHLDYHAGMEEYLAAKLRLFEHLLAPNRPAVIDADSDAAGRVIAASLARGLKVVSVGRNGNFLRLLDSVAEDFATRLAIEHEGRTYRVNLPLAGDFQAKNALVAAGLALATGGAPDRVFASLEKLEGAPGRLELVGRRRNAPIFVDYAHKPDALDKALRALRPLVRKNLVVVFGCGGDRDPGKRPIMGEVAARLADEVIVTDDNPRSEDPAAIRRAILAGAKAISGAEISEIGDRGQAIAHAVGALQEGDVLLIAGKGHETGQIVGDRTLPFSDQQCVRAALKDFAA